MMIDYWELVGNQWIRDLCKKASFRKSKVKMHPLFLLGFGTEES